MYYTFSLLTKMFLSFKENYIKDDIDSMFASQLISLIVSIESDQLGEDARCRQNTMECRKKINF